MTHVYANDSRGQWMGALPDGWQSTRLPSIVIKRNNGKPVLKEYWYKGNNIVYTCAKNGFYVNFNSFPDNLKTGLNDLLLTRVANPYVFVPNEGSLYTDMVYRLVLTNTVNRSYIAYALRCASKYIRRQGVTMDSLNFQRWGQLVFPLPPKDVQEKIAAYLDREVSLMDHQMDAIEQSIPLLKKRRQALISEQIMSDSSCNKIRFRYLFDVVSERTNVLTNVMAMENIEKFSGRFVPKSTPFVANNGVAYEVNDILLNRMGVNNAKVWLSDKVGVALGELYVFRPNVQRILPRYAKWSLLSWEFTESLMKYERGVAMKRAPLDKVLGIELPIPDFDYQQKVVDYLDVECGKIDRTIDLYRQMYDVLKQRRESLIYEAVTGKIPLENMK